MISSVAVIGGGQGGATLARALRLRGYAGRITLVCGEATLPYERPPLSKGFLAGEDSVLVAPADFYSDHDIEVLLGHRASEVRPHGSGLEVLLDPPVSLRADAVVLATGSRPRQLDFPGVRLANVLSLSTIEDAQRIRDRLPEVHHAVIAGAGFVGTEVAAALRTRGCDVVLVEPAPRPLERALGGWAAEFVRELHHSAGVRFIQDVIAAVEGRDHVQQVETAHNGRLPCDLLIVAVGNRPNTEIAVRSGLDHADGIVCDDQGRTSMSGVYAVGDVALWPCPALGRLRVEHFRTAIDHAEIVAASLLGQPVTETLVPWFWTDQYQHRVEVAGSPDQGTIRIERNGRDGRPLLSLHLREQRLVGAIGIDCSREVRTASRLIRTHGIVDPAILADPSTDLRKAASSA